MSAEHKTLFRRFAEDALNQGVIEVIDDVFNPDVVSYMPFFARPVTGVEAVKEITAMLRAAFPDLHVRPDDMLAEDDRLSVRGTVRGTNTGEFLGRPGTGKTATWTIVSTCRIKDNRIVEWRATFDRLGILEQLGLIAEPPIALLAHEEKADKRVDPPEGPCGRIELPRSSRDCRMPSGEED